MPSLAEILEAYTAGYETGDMRKYAIPTQFLHSKDLTRAYLQGWEDQTERTFHAYHIRKLLTDILPPSYPAPT